MHEAGLVGQVRQDAPRRLAPIVAGTPRLVERRRRSARQRPYRTACFTVSGNDVSDFSLLGKSFVKTSGPATVAT